MKVLKKFLPYYKPHLTIFILDMIAAFFISICDMVFPLVTRFMLNDFVANKKLNLLLIAGCFLAIIFAIKYFLGYFVTYYGHLMGVRMQRDMRREIFDHVETLPVSYFDNHKTGAIMTRITSDLFDVSELAHHGPEDFFLSLFTIFGSFTIMAVIYWPLALILFTALPVFVLFAVKIRKKVSKAAKRSKEEVAKINGRLENSIAGVRVTKAYTAKEYENEEFAKQNEIYVDVRGSYYQIMGRFTAGTTLITDVLLIIMYLAGGLFCYFDSAFTIVDFTVFVLYISTFTNPIKKLIAFEEQYQNGMTGFERFLEIMALEPEKDEENAVSVERAEGVVEFKNINFAYDNQIDVLKNLSFNIPKGYKLALVGESGGGKTTVCHLLPRFYEPFSGEILIDGVNIKNMTRESLRKNVGMVEQDVFLFNDTIEENIRYGSFGATREEVIKAAKAANIHEYIESLPDGYNTVVGERGVKLSGGQKQRIAIARVFLKDPPILVLDEATSALDTTTEIAISKSLDKLSEGRTTIVVAHRLSTVMNSDRILVIGNGEVVEQGTHKELLQKNGIYASLWNVSYT